MSGAPSPAARFVFWWLLLVVVQQAQRVFLLGAAARREAPSPGVLGLTLLTGLRADLVTASAGMLGAAAVALVVGALVALRRRDRARAAAARALGVAGALLAVVYVAVLTVDMGYYLYSGQRLDAVFMEYVSDLMGQGRQGRIAGSQVATQTVAEVSEVGTWAPRVAAFTALMTAAVLAWRVVFRRALAPALAARRRLTAVLLPLAVAIGAWGAHPGGPDSVQSAPITSSAYYALAQSPIWYVANVLDASTKRGGVPPAILAVMPEARAIPLAREVLVPGGRFVSPRYPLVHVDEPRPPLAGRTPNVLLIFVEALDRRFLGRTVAGRKVTPFLDALREDSVYFENFFANGANTFNGLFASLCSSLPRYGTAATKARYANDYLCLPTLLGRGGYRTRMIIGQNRDRSHSRLGLFMARNGLEELIDDRGFPRGAPRMGLGMTDGALFDRVRAEIDALRAGGRPWFLTTLTTSTHHPFTVPDTHPDVAALRAEPDRFLAALRYLDLELERFVSGLRSDGALRDTVVLVLGDHGRHERVSPTDLENEAGHFMVPLMVWLDPSLRSPATYRPRVVSAVASQLDLTPTITGWAGLTPRLSSFVGGDLGCALTAECLPDRAVYLNEVYDHGAGLADREGFWFYSFATRAVQHIDLGLRGPARRFEPGDPAAAARVERILALYVTANQLIEKNALWNWKEFADRL